MVRNRATKKKATCYAFQVTALLTIGTLTLLKQASSRPAYFQQAISRSPSLYSQQYLSGHSSRLESGACQSIESAVSWDGRTLFVHGQRIFLWSGEFHPWRLPVVKLWRDILQKIKAAGMNAVSIYVHWGLSHPSPGQLDFGGYRSLDTFLDMAMEEGLWVVLRPGPYINAETSGARISTGGIPHWVTSQSPFHLRTNNSFYLSAWSPYIAHINAVVRKYQVTTRGGGPIIAVQMENEYVDRDDVGYPGKREMMIQLKEAMKSGGIVVPLTINDAYMGANYVRGDGAGDIYGFDSYPQSFDCSHSSVWKPVVPTHRTFHEKTNPDQPLYIPEFQGGAYDPWGPDAPGYASCANLTGAHFQSVFHLNLWAANAKMVNIYMLYGGTSWGHLPFPGVYTSYDYGAAITENRSLSPAKYAELKRQGMFLRGVREFQETNFIREGVIKSDASLEADGTHETGVFATVLRNPGGAEFWIVRHEDSTSSDTTTFHLNVNVTFMNNEIRQTRLLKIPQYAASITLAGRRSKVITSNLLLDDTVPSNPLLDAGATSFLSRLWATGSQWIFPTRILRSHRASKSTPLRSDEPTVLYSTAEIFLTGLSGDNRQIIFLTGDSAEEHEFSIRLRGRPVESANTVHDVTDHVRMKTFRWADDGKETPDGINDAQNGFTVVSVLRGFDGLATIWDSDEQLVIFADTRTVDTYWAPTLEDADANGSTSHQCGLSGVPCDAHQYRNFYSFGTNTTILVGGPDLVRKASYSKARHTLDIFGDVDVGGDGGDIWLSVIGGPRDVKSVRWNGQEVGFAQGGAVRTYVLQSKKSVGRFGRFDPPVLANWKYADSLPEIGVRYDDALWVDATNETTHIPTKPVVGKKVLYGCDYGFCEGIVLWRGHFTATGNETGVRLVVNGGEGGDEFRCLLAGHLGTESLIVAFAASVYINDVFIRTTYGNSTNNRNIIRETDEVYEFPDGCLEVGKDNVVTVVQDNMGIEETWNSWDTDGSRSPRGIRGYQLLPGGDFDSWKVQGKIGGYWNFRDKQRGIFNEGGLFGERHGWHLPPDELSASESDFEQTPWVKRDISEGLPARGRYVQRRQHDVNDTLSIGMHGHAGVGFFRTTFSLKVPKGYDVMMSFEFVDRESLGQPYRALLFVNGWMMGKRVGNLGPQTKFPVHEGILNYDGENAVVVALWAMDAEVPIRTSVRLVTDRVFDGSLSYTTRGITT
ncbi:hypothetical protein FRB99_005786 [Tulasnella sp. 403]|nr:hypothetical protein FRB99_005786 [Tulasnella sp. 403]